MIRSIIFSIYNSVVITLNWLLSTGFWDDVDYWVDARTWSDLLSVLNEGLWNDLYYWNDETPWED